jgi:predicted flap endonuclease-1-like 5' DNA nuclease
MTYLLVFGWPWFAGALALGALVGFLTCSRDRDAAFSGGWVVLLGAAMLALGGAAILGDIFSGRDATTLEIGLLAGLAYSAGLPLGGGLKSLGAATDGDQATPPRIVLARATAPAGAAMLDAPQPSVAEAAPSILPDAAPQAADPPANGQAGDVGTPATISEILRAEDQISTLAPAPATPSQPVRAPKALPGAKPETLPAPRGGVADDLARIKGVGPKSLQKLNALGVFHYDQIAAWNLDNARWVGATIGAPGRVERDKWIQQARALAGAESGKQ